MNKEFFKKIIFLAGFFLLISSAQPASAIVNGKLYIIKNTIGSDNSFLYKVSGPETRDINIQTINGYGDNEIDGVKGEEITPGEYSITEELLSGWRMDYGYCEMPNGSLVEANSQNTLIGVQIIPGDITICAFQNTLTTAPPRITVTKILSPDTGDSGRFNLTINGITHATNVGHNGTTGPVTVPTGAFLVGETAEPGTNLTDYMQSFSGDCSSPPAPLLQNGDNRICYITNTKITPNTATITLVKNTTNGGSGTFNFSNNLKNSSGGSISIPSLNPNGVNGFSDKTTITGIMPGNNYSIAESSLPAGFSLTNATCTNGRGIFDSAKNRITSIALASGENITCTFTNAYTAPSTGTIQFIKNTLGAPVGTFNFITNGFSLNQNPVTTASVTATTGRAIQNITVPVAVAGYSISENQPPVGWSFTFASCKFPNGASAGTSLNTGVTAISVNANQITTCTFTNTFETLPPAPVINYLSPATGVAGSAPFDFYVNGANFVSGAIIRFNGVNTTKTVNYVGPNQVFIQNYSFATAGNYLITVVNPNGQVSNAVNFPVTAGNATTGIKIIKKTNGTGSGTFRFSNNFGAIIRDLTPNSSNFFQDEYIIGNLTAGSNYTIGEIANTVTGWTLTNASCDKGGVWNSNSILNIPVVQGQTTVCTFVNTFSNSNVLPKLTVNKILIPSSDSGRFNLQIDNTTAGTGANVGNGGTTGPITVSIGSHTIRETVVTGTNPSDYDYIIGGDCAADGSITLTGGQNKVCTITNTKKPKLTVNKVLSTGINAGFNLFINNTQYASNIGSGGTTGAKYANIGSNTFYETAVSGVNLSDYDSVVSGTGCGGSATAGTITLSAGENKTCTITNTRKNQNGSIVIKKNVTGNTGPLMFCYNLTGASVNNVCVNTSGGSNNTGLSQPISAPANTNASITEIIPTGWELDTVSCDKTASAGATGVSSVTVLSGQTTTCTFTNFETTTNPVPVITSISPASKDQCDIAKTLTVTGTGFIKTSKIYFNSLAVPTNYVSSTKLTTDISSVPEGSYTITVVNPGPGGGTSNDDKIFIVSSQGASTAPTITSISPESADEGSKGFQLTVNGNNFIANSVVSFNGNTKLTTYISSKKLIATIPDTDIEKSGSYDVTITNPSTNPQTCQNQISLPKQFIVNPLESEIGGNDNNVDFILPPQPPSN